MFGVILLLALFGGFSGQGIVPVAYQSVSVPEPQTIRVGRGNPQTKTAQEPAQPPRTASQYSCDEIAAALAATGLPRGAQRIGAGVALAESGGRSAATAITPWEHSVGVYQINLLSHPTFSEECARSLQCASAIVAKLSRGGTDWSPWSAYTSGAYVGRC